jgi:hypothetical protein
VPAADAREPFDATRAESLERGRKVCGMFQQDHAYPRTPRDGFAKARVA